MCVEKLSRFGVTVFAADGNAVLFVCHIWSIKVADRIGDAAVSLPALFVIVLLLRRLFYVAPPSPFLCAAGGKKPH